MSITAATAYPRAIRTLAEMMEVLRQFQQGLVTPAEVILSLQLTPHQVDAVVTHSRLPYSIQQRSCLGEWDEEVTIKQERGDTPMSHFISI